MEAEVSFCRVCRGEGTTEEPLFFPCRCSGSIKYVHQSCLEEWLAHSNKKYCELCGYEYAFSPLYDPSMPATIPRAIVMRQMLVNVAGVIAGLIRLVLVIVVWLFVLPYVVYWLTRFYFWSGQSVSFGVQSRNATLSGVGAAFNATEIVAAGTRRFEEFDTWHQWFMHAHDNGTVAPISSYTGLLDGSTNAALLLYSVVRIVLRAGVDAMEMCLGISISSQQFNSLAEMVVEFNAKSLEGSAVTVIALLAFMGVFMLRDWIITNAPIDDDILEDVEEQINDEQINDEQMEQQQDNPEPPHLLQVEGRPIEAENPQHRPLFEHPPHEVPALEDLPPDERPVRPLQTDGPAFDDTAQPDIWADNIRDNEYDNNNAQLLHRAAGSSRSDNDVSDSSTESDVQDADEPETDNNAFARLMDTLPAELRPAGYTREEYTGRHGRNPSEQRTGWAYADEAFDDQSSDSDNSVQDVQSEPYDEAQPLEAGEERNLSLMSSEVDDTSVNSDEGQANVDAEQSSPAESSDAWSFVNRGESSRSVAGGSQNTDGVVDMQTPPTFTGESSRAIYAHARQGSNASSNSSSSSDADDEVLLEEARLRAAEEAAMRFREERAAAEQVQAGDAGNLGLVLNDDEGDQGGDFVGAEDIWEAIGLRGPLANPLQYFVLVLIVVGMVLAFFAWLPYICGRAFVAMNPVRMVLCGAHVLVTTIDTVSEIVLEQLPALAWRHMQPVLASVVDVLGPAVVYPVSFIIPGLREALSAVDGRMWAKLAAPKVQQLVAERLQQSWVIQILFPWSRVGPTRTMSSESVLESTGWIPEWVRAMITTGSARELRGTAGLLDWEQRLWQRLVGIGIPIDTIVEKMNAAASGTSLDSRMSMIVLGHTLGVVMAWAVVTYTPRSLQRSALFGSARMFLRMAKVVFFICIELVVFPVVCGYCLDVSLMPLLASASIGARVQELLAHRWAALFTHWLLGLLFMVHFARFVLHCRHVMRPGLLWFIRDPNDPEFHPMREILEDRMLPQQYNIARSALMYCGIILACVGLSMTLAARTAPSVFPMQWRGDARFGDHPTGILLMVFLLPVAVMWGRPNEVLHALFSRWWRVAARTTRLSEFVLGERSIVDEGEWTLRRMPWLPVLAPRLWMPTDVVERVFNEFDAVDEARAGPVPGALPTHEYYVQLQCAIDAALAQNQPQVTFTLGSGGNFRVPTVDTVPVVPGRIMLVQVDGHGRPVNSRYDYEAADDVDLRDAAEREGRVLPPPAPESSYRDRRFRREHYTVVYVPPGLRARMCGVLAMGWLAVAVLSSSTLVLSLIIGRRAYARMSNLPMHDMYALSIGLLVLLIVAVLVFRLATFLHNVAANSRAEWTRELRRRAVLAWTAAWKAALTAAVFFGAVPAVYGLVVEVYFVVLLRHMAASPEVEVAFERTMLQAMAHNWMFGVLHVWVGLSLLRVFPALWWSRQLERLFTGPPHTWHVGRSILVFALPLIGVSVATAALPFAVAACIMWYRGELTADAMLRAFRLVDLDVLALSVKAVLGTVLIVAATWQACLLYRKWSQSARDRVYLVGHQLHNLDEPAENISAETTADVPLSV
ncbi:hypothetical protein GGF45_001248 [Coemansia sp. RSA 551]|nr:hypothetical protein GGF45_001248 [Coemansia sp. RSA 551]